MSGEAPDESVEASDAFQALGSATRTTVLEALADGSRSFSALHETTDEETSAGFAYHLRQLDGRFVRQREDETYELTHAGREVVRSIRTGTYTESVDREPVELDDDCPRCQGLLRASVTDNVTEIRCADCETPVLAMSLPPGGYESRDPEAIPGALDTYHRRRIQAFADGVCPDCGGSVDVDVEPATVPTDGEDAGDEVGTDEDRHVPVQTAFACETCGSDLRCPVTLTVLDHPAVVAFYHDHGFDVRERPIWNVGTEWRERVISRDPWCVVVSTRLDGDELALYLARDGTVVDHRRTHHDDDDGTGRPIDTVPAEETTSEAGRPDEFPRAEDDELPADSATA